jgi:hypothetical protein
MKSLRKAASNQRNAKRSSGPKTSIGRARSALNAATHGLSRKMVLGEGDQKRSQQLVNALAGAHDKNPEILMLAHEAAEALIYVERVIKARVKAWNDAPRHRSVTNRGTLAALNNPIAAKEYKRLEGISVSDIRKLMPNEFMEPFENNMERDAQVMKVRLDTLTKFLRYELRAINRRNRLLKALDEAVGRRQRQL